LRLRSDVEGSSLISAQVNAQNDRHEKNNEGTGTIQIEAQAPVASVQAPTSSVAPPTSATSTSGGGGGSMGVLWLAAVGLLARWRRTRP
jgi:MYXO-CTERM domain-containing protein